MQLVTFVILPIIALSGKVVYMMNTNTTRKYEVVKTFTSGLLKGLTITEQTTVKFAVGLKTKEYRVVAVRVVL